MRCEMDVPDIVKKGMRYEMVLKAEFWWWWCGGWLAWPSSSSSGIKLWKINVQWKLRKKCKASKYAGRYTLPTREFQQELIMNLHGCMRENCHVSIEQMINSNIFAFPSFFLWCIYISKIKVKLNGIFILPFYFVLCLKSSKCDFLFPQLSVRNLFIFFNF